MDRKKNWEYPCQSGTEKRLNILGHINARPLITVLLSKKDISYSDKVQCLKNIERFNLIHYRLNNYNPTWQNSLFYNLGRDLYNESISINEVLETTSTADYLSENNVIITPGVIDKFNRLFKRDGFYTWKSLKIQNLQLCAKNKLKVGTVIKRKI